jgi:hypothetical protein
MQHKVLKDCLTSIRYKQISLENPVSNAATVKALPQFAFVFPKQRDNNRANKIHPKMYHDSNTQNSRDSGSRCSALLGFVNNWSTFAGLSTLRLSVHASLIRLTTRERAWGYHLQPAFLAPSIG